MGAGAGAFGEKAEKMVCGILPTYRLQAFRILERFTGSSHGLVVPSSPTPPSVMADAFDNEQRELSQLWKKARKDGCLPPWEQAKVFGLKEAWEEMHGQKTYGQATWIAERVCVQGRIACGYVGCLC